VTTIIVKKDFSPQAEKQAQLKASVFRPAKVASKADRVLDMADCAKTVCLCFSHASKFDRKAQMKYGYYMQKEYPHVMANCDACQVFDKCHLFIHESVLKDVWRTREQARREREYACIV
jgi:hypothetical protein